jgi:hypothetical protein
VSRQHLEQCRFFASQQFDRGSSAWTLGHRAGLNACGLRFGDQIKFWPLVFSHGEKATSQGVTLSVRSSTLRIREVPSLPGSRCGPKSLEVISLEVIG